MNDGKPDLQAALTAARQERSEILARLHERMGRMEVDEPPTLSPFEPSAPASPVIEVARDIAAENAGPSHDVLRTVLEGFDATAADMFDEHSTPFIVVSLSGLRRLDALFSELEQRRESAGDA